MPEQVVDSVISRTLDQTTNKDYGTYSETLKDSATSCAGSSKRNGGGSCGGIDILDSTVHTLLSRTASSSSLFSFFSAISMGKQHEQTTKTRHYDNLNSSKDNNKNKDDTLHRLQRTLIRQESSLGRYTPMVAHSYRSIGKLYFDRSRDDESALARAVIMYRACHRIEMVLYGSSCHGSIANNDQFRQALLQRGVPDSKISIIERDMEESMLLEVEADRLRRLGRKFKAKAVYQQAAKVEEATFGRENPCLAFLWRKIACLTAIVQDDDWMDAININDMDSILRNKWLRRQYTSSALSEPQSHQHQLQQQQQDTTGRRDRHLLFHPKVCSTIQKGDELYKTFYFTLAVQQYMKATTFDDRESRRRRSRSNSSQERQKRRNRRTSRSTSSTRRRRRSRSRSVEGRGNSPSTANTTTTSGSRHRHHARSRSSERQNSSRKERRSRSKSREGQSSHRSRSRSSRRGRRVTTKHQHTAGASSTTNLPIEDELQTFLNSSTTAVSKTTTVAVAQPTKKEAASSLSKVKEEARSQSEDSQPILPLQPIPPKEQSEHQTVISKSTKRRSSQNKRNKPTTRSSLSGASMYNAIKHYVDPKRPKSDSYLTKLAAKTSKIATQTTKQIYKKTLAVGSFHGGSSHGNPHGASSSDHARPQSDSYALLGSPPMTPLDSSNSSNPNRKFLTKDVIPQNSFSRGISFLDVDDPSTEPLSPPKREKDYDSTNTLPESSTSTRTSTKSLQDHLKNNQQLYPASATTTGGSVDSSSMLSFAVESSASSSGGYATTIASSSGGSFNYNYTSSEHNQIATDNANNDRNNNQALSSSSSSSTNVLSIVFEGSTYASSTKSEDE